MCNDQSVSLQRRFSAIADLGVKAAVSEVGVVGSVYVPMYVGAKDGRPGNSRLSHGGKCEQRL